MTSNKAYQFWGEIGGGIFDDEDDGPVRLKSDQELEGCESWTGEPCEDCEHDNPPFILSGQYRTLDGEWVTADSIGGLHLSYVADDGDGNRATISYPHELSGEDVHRAAAIALCEKMGWSGADTLAGGSTKRGYVFVFTDEHFTICPDCGFRYYTRSWTGCPQQHQHERGRTVKEELPPHYGDTIR